MLVDSMVNANAMYIDPCTLRRLDNRTSYSTKFYSTTIPVNISSGEDCLAVWGLVTSLSR